MKSLILCKPFETVKSYSLCIEDHETNSVRPIIFLNKAIGIEEEDYHDLVSNLRIQLKQNYDMSNFGNKEKKG